VQLPGGLALEELHGVTVEMSDRGRGADQPVREGEGRRDCSVCVRRGHSFGDSGFTW
jgi:hypothetical protein